MGKRPSFQNYPGDWLRDNVAGCSLAAQGLWLRMMYIAHDSDRYGYLQQNGHAIPEESIARRCGAASLAEYMALLTELDAAGVPSRTPNGVIFSRRMVRDERERSQTAERVRNFRKDNGNGNGHVTQRYEVEEEGLVPSKSSKTKSTDLEAIYKCYPRKVGKGDALKAISKAFQRLVSGEDPVDGLLRSYEDVLAFLVAKVTQFGLSPAGQAGEYTPHPATWFNKKRYLDDDREWSRAGNEQQHYGDGVFAVAPPPTPGEPDPDCEKCHGKGVRLPSGYPDKRENYWICDCRYKTAEVSV